MTSKIAKTLLAAMLIAPLTLEAQESSKLTGTVIGTTYSVDYATGEASTTVNTKECAFDGQLDTYFASYDRTMTWAGLDLKTPHVITRVGWSPRNDALGPGRVQLAVFEGANQADFSDAVPLFINDVKTPIGEYGYADVNVSQGFRYVRYVGPNDARCNVAEIEFYGYEGAGEKKAWYRPGNIPVVSIQVENAQEPWDKENDLNCTVTLIPSDPTDTIMSKTATVRLRGNASMTFPKKPYRIKFDKKQNVFGSPAKAKKWTLINNYGDKTLMRNILAFDLSRRMGMAYTSFIQPVDVFVNGEYKGCYQLCDQIEVASKRVDVEEMDETCTSGSELTGGYLIEVDAYAPDETWYFYSQRGNPVTIKYPSDDEIQFEQYDYIQEHFDKFETQLFSADFDKEDGYRKYLDLESFMRHFLVGELAGNTDTYWSVYMYKHRDDDHLYVGPVWDFDLAYENDGRTYPINSLHDWIYRTRGSIAGNFRDDVDRIVVYDKQALARLEELWAEFRDNCGLDEETLLALVDKTAEELYPSQKLNFIRWDILSTMVHQNWQASGTYEGEVSIVKKYIQERLDWIDNKLNYDPSALTQPEVAQPVESSDIYSIDGRNVGRDVNTLPRGLYVTKGKKIVVR